MPIVDHLRDVYASLCTAAKKSGRDPASITLVAVSKKKSVDEMRAYGSAATRLEIPIVFGENYLQELKQKRLALGSEVQIHLIGALQSNKVKEAVALADVIESVHSIKVLELIAQEARKLGKRQAIFLQVNIGNDPHKSGFSVTEIGAVIDVAAQYPDAIELRGLMTITPFYETAELARSDFGSMAKLRARLQVNGKARSFHQGTILLSMGMSADFTVAIEEGADIVRVGSAIFGER